MLENFQIYSYFVSRIISFLDRRVLCAGSGYGAEPGRDSAGLAGYSRRARDLYLEIHRENTP